MLNVESANPATQFVHRVRIKPMESFSIAIRYEIDGSLDRRGVTTDQSNFSGAGLPGITAYSRASLSQRGIRRCAGLWRWIALECRVGGSWLAALVVA